MTFFLQMKNIGLSGVSLLKKVTCRQIISKNTLNKITQKANNFTNDCIHIFKNYKVPK